VRSLLVEPSRRRSRLGRAGVIGAIAAAAVAGCGSSDAPRRAAAAVAEWRPALHVKSVVDVAGPRRDGRLVLAADGRLDLLRPGGRPAPFARGRGGYSTRRRPESYIAVSSGQAVSGAGCHFPRDSVYALEPQGRTGVVAVSAAGRAGRLANVRMPGLLNGIAFDTTGRFGHRLLVTVTAASHTTVLGIDCRGRKWIVTRTAPVLEGGIVVAPASFGRFAGQLIAPDEKSGRVLAIASNGRARLVADSGLPNGQDIGVESGGFVPPVGAGWRAYVADRVSPGNAHPGNDAVLAIGGKALLKARVRPGDLLLASEGGGQTVAVRCHQTCSVTRVAGGPATAHVEGHIAFASP
jgi:hypothetical protein